MSEVVAILCADLHLSYNPPTARSAEPDWLVAQVRPLDQLRDLVGDHRCRILCAGDVFDKHNAGPPLVNWAIRNLPKMYAVPGQHDLPHHSLGDVGKSAYWTLKEVGLIADMSSGASVVVPGGELVLWGFPWGAGLESCNGSMDGRLSIAVIHKFIWRKGCGYPGAPEEAKVSHLGAGLEGYDVAVFGDNHHAFSAVVGGCVVWNCGCLIRRRQDERGLKPSVGLLHEDGRIKRHYLDVSDDKWIDPADDPAAAEGPEATGLGEFLDELRGLEVDSLDFREAVRRYVADNKGELSEGARKMLLSVIGG